jgi:predicted AAA+ superfamily ATPase
MLRRKIDSYLKAWKENNDKYPLIIKGARQIGKTTSILKFAKENYENVISINFILEKEYKDIFDDGYQVDSILKNISLRNPSFKFVPGKTLLFFDEIQECINTATSLKAFKLDGRFDVICSGSLMGINYHEIESVSVGYKEDYNMYSMDFLEFLWAKGYQDEQIEELYQKMLKTIPLSNVEMSVFLDAFYEYMIIGGMPKVVDTFIKNNNYSGTLQLQRQILLDYEEDIHKYAYGLDKMKILNVFRKIPVFLGQDNKKFQITKVAKGARSKNYIGVIEWLLSAGIVNVCYCMDNLELPLKGNYNPNNYKLYFMDTGLLVASLDDEASYDLRANKNFKTYKGGIYENIVSDMLVKSGYDLYFYKNTKSTLEMDFFLRNADYLIPVEVKSTDGSTKTLNRLLNNEKYPDIKYGIKLCKKNIGFNGKVYTFPYFLTFLLKRFLKEKELGT